MLSRWLNVRADERALAATAFAFLTVLVASHSVLETARDALFLARLPPSRLPLVYFAIAVCSLLVWRAQGRYAQALDARRALALGSVAAAAGTFALFWLVPRPEAGGAGLGLYVLYVWSGVVAAVILVDLWSLLAEAFSITQAKRLYPLIGSGSVLGALLGSALATVVARHASADRLVLLAGGGFLLAALLAAALARASAPASTSAGADVRAGVAREPEPATLAEATRLALRAPYLRRVAGLVLASAACATFVDYAFKSAVSARVPAHELGAFFAAAALAFNVLSLLVQLTLARLMLQRAPVSATLAVLPGALALGGLALALGGGLAAALFVKGADGALRHSLHRTAGELLYVPLPDRARPRIKALLDVAGTRSGQALAALAILALSAWSLPNALLGAALSAIACGSIALAFALRARYVELLRSNVRGALAPRAAFPELDVASLETLVGALDSANDAEVLAALDVLEREHKARLVPAMILHHPSEAVVEHALALFTRTRRAAVVPVVDRLLEHASPRVRCAAVAARASLAPDARWLYLRLSLEESPEVRATILVHLIASREIVGGEARERLRALVERGPVSARVALAQAIAGRSDPELDAQLPLLADAPELDVRLAALAAMARNPSRAQLPALVRALGDERTRGAARTALLAFGDDGLDAVRAALRDARVTASLRWELPRTLAAFASQAAADALLAQLAVEQDGMVRYRILRALESLVAKEPTVQLARARLDSVIASTLSLAFEQLAARLTLEDGAMRDERRRTPGHELLARVLADKQEHALDRLLRLLGLAHPQADMARIRVGLRSSAQKARASCVELLGELLRPPLRGAVLALLDDRPDAERLRAAGPFYAGEPLDYEALLEHMLQSESEAVQDFTAFHVGELGLRRFAPRLTAIVAADGARADMARALAQLDATRAESAC